MANLANYVVVLSGISAIEQKENGNSIRYYNQNLQTFARYDDALAFARQQQRNLRAATKATDVGYENLYVCHKTRGDTRAITYLTRDKETSASFDLD